MSNIKSKYILDFFKTLNKENVQYMLIKNIGKELPHNLKDGKDIDIIVKLEDREHFSKIMGANGYLFRLPPLGTNGGWKFGYQLPEYQFWQKSKIEQTLYIDACFKLMCKSLTPKFWVPLDETINKRAWKEKQWNEELKCWQLDEKTLFVYLFARCVFDKKTFSPVYITEIEERKNLINDTEVYAMLKTLFYNFADTLIDMVKKSEYEKIIHKYITFKNY